MCRVSQYLLLSKSKGNRAAKRGRGQVSSLLGIEHQLSPYCSGSEDISKERRCHHYLFAPYSLVMLTSVFSTLFNIWSHLVENLTRKWFYPCLEVSYERRARAPPRGGHRFLLRLSIFEGCTLSPLYRRGNWGSVRPSKLCKVIYPNQCYFQSIAIGFYSALNQLKLKIQLFSFTCHIWSAQEPHVAQWLQSRTMQT